MMWLTLLAEIDEMIENEIIDQFDEVTLEDLKKILEKSVDTPEEA